MPSQISASAQKEKNASANARERFGGTVGLWTGIQLDFKASCKSCPLAKTFGVNPVRSLFVDLGFVQLSCVGGGLIRRPRQRVSLQLQLSILAAESW
jgi:hypothetical protein